MKLGNIVTGSDFFDRNTECADIWRYLENEHVVASGSRRLGKSSIVNRLREEAITKGLLAEHVDDLGPFVMPSPFASHSRACRAPIISFHSLHPTEEPP